MADETPKNFEEEIELQIFLQERKLKKLVEKNFSELGISTIGQTRLLIFMFTLLPDSMENLEITFNYFHQPFFNFLRKSGLVKHRGCRKICLTKAFWDLRKRYLSGEKIWDKT